MGFSTRLGRRTFLAKGLTGAGALGALALAPGLVVSPPFGGRAAAAGVGSRPAAEPLAGPASVPLPDTIVFYVRDVNRGEVGMLVDTEEIVVEDRVLVAHLLHALTARAF